jgi:hypothetical protein
MTNQDVPAQSVKAQGDRPCPPAVIVHGLAHLRLALAQGRPVTLLSAQAAGALGGALWWRALMRQGNPAMPDILDCGDDAAAALAALREGQRILVLTGPAVQVVTQAAATVGARILRTPPPALDLRLPAASRRLEAWLAQ